MKRSDASVDPRTVPLPDALRRAPGIVAQRGRGATFNPANRFRRETREATDDGWLTQRELPSDAVHAPDNAAKNGASDVSDDALPPLATTVTIQRARTIIARNASPDIPFTQSVNPYQGCEHEIRTTRRVSSP